MLESILAVFPLWFEDDLKQKSQKQTSHILITYLKTRPTNAKKLIFS